MATDIVMPKLGMSMEEGTVVEWLKNEGERVEQGEPVVTISSEKTEIEVEAPDSGILTIVVPQDGVVPVSEVIGRVSAEGAVVQPRNGETINEKNQHSEKSTTQKTPISPAARKLAKKEKIDLSGIQGTGPGNRITKEDVLKAIANKKEAAATLETYHRQNVKTASEEIREVPVSGIRKVIADRMFQSLQQSAQLTLHTEVDVTELVRVRQQMKEDIAQRFGVNLTYNDFIARATVLALQNHPQLNAKWDENQIIQYGHIHLGIAFSTNRGLMVPVVRNAQEKSLIQLSQGIKSLTSAGKDGSLSMDESKGSTFTITNLGSYGVDEFTPILNPPEVGILGVGRINEKPAIYDGEITIRALMKLSLTFDHRVLDGAPAAEFLQELSSYIENPYRLISFEDNRG
ncbi:pyruvate dehydrogenase E2 component (dihydrolipoamide acetyltransferase) [Melghirimyces profundicolus]|uniref:Dihydrolipoamide acetyltransferase component of pyruvate dehydrogenase complex n=1 Tax=Melghirimyces profundicolus TaxID=1242148 RepID=A0A2T6BD35_9BACL|nr:dihydrolipoamide acetyltransferase family protein [Melghirimyces profundicolus]PTX53956.1 pyruvate dehydrogenase E2 component (dihydrolipoamide acetyltransferase) [Melghirimyces profundicolus]